MPEERFTPETLVEMARRMTVIRYTERQLSRLWTELDVEFVSVHNDILVYARYTGGCVITAKRWLSNVIIHPSPDILSTAGTLLETWNAKEPVHASARPFVWQRRGFATQPDSEGRRSADPSGFERGNFLILLNLAFILGQMPHPKDLLLFEQLADDQKRHAYAVMCDRLGKMLEEEVRRQDRFSNLM